MPMKQSSTHPTQYSIGRISIRPEICYCCARCWLKVLCDKRDKIRHIDIHIISKLISNSINPHSWLRYTNATCGHLHAQYNILKMSTLKIDVLLLWCSNHSWLLPSAAAKLITAFKKESMLSSITATTYGWETAWSANVFDVKRKARSEHNNSISQLRECNVRGLAERVWRFFPLAVLFSEKISPARICFKAS